MEVKVNSDLASKLLEYLGEIDINEPLEVKPSEEVYNEDDKIKNKKPDKELYERDYSTKLDKQLDNIRIKYCHEVF